MASKISAADENNASNGFIRCRTDLQADLSIGIHLKGNRIFIGTDITNALFQNCSITSNLYFQGTYSSNFYEGRQYFWRDFCTTTAAIGSLVKDYKNRRKDVFGPPSVVPMANK